MKAFFSCFLFCASGTSALLAQMAGPVASAYFDVKDKFYIACYDGKNIVELGRDGSQKVFITGLTAPNNIYYGDFPLAQGFAVLDSNEVKLYDTAGSYVGKESISGAKKLTDATMDTVTGGTMSVYTCDVLRGVIYKTTFPPPFYFPSTSIWVSGLVKPASLLVQPANGRLLYTEDSANARIMSINLSTKAVSVFYNTGTSNVVGLAEDGQGNLYFSSQGSAYIYQINKYLSSPAKKVISEPKPGDLTILPGSDDICYTCIKCGTVFISKIHNFGPGNELMACQRDSVYSYANILFKNFGTFENGNEFLLKYTVLSASLNTGTIIGRIKDTLVPSEIRGKLPNNLKPGTYKIYWESTKPKIARTWNTLNVFSPPVADLFEKDTAAGCGSASIKLGKNNHPDSNNFDYQWTVNGSLLNSKASENTFSFTSNRWIKIDVNDINTNCKNSDSVFLLQQTTPVLNNWTDSLKACENENIKLGPPANNLYLYHWSGKNLGDDSLSPNPQVKAVNSGNYNLLVYIQGCSTNYNLHLKVNPAPYVVLQSPSIVSYCQNQAVSGTNTIQSLSPNTTFSYRESSSSALINKTSTGVFGNLEKGICKFWLQNNFGCKDSGSFQVIEYEREFVIIEKKDTLSLSNPAYINTKWFKKDTSGGTIATGNFFAPADSGLYIACANRPSADCRFCDSHYYTPAPKINKTLNSKKSTITLYPNPVKQGEKLQLTGFVDETLNLYNSQGQLITKQTGNEISTEKLMPGLYYLKSEAYHIVKFVVYR